MHSSVKSDSWFCSVGNVWSFNNWSATLVYLQCAAVTTNVAPLTAFISSARIMGRVLRRHCCNHFHRSNRTVSSQRVRTTARYLTVVFFGSVCCSNILASFYFKHFLYVASPRCVRPRTKCTPSMSKQLWAGRECSGPILKNVGSCNFLKPALLLTGWASLGCERKKLTNDGK